MPEEILTEAHKSAATLSGKLSFRHFPDYARFIKENYLIPYIQEQLRISRQINLPLLKFFAGISDADLISMSVQSNTEFLTYVEENRLQEQLERSMSLWVADELGILKRDEVTAEDISLTSYMRKKALIKFLPSYTSDVHESLEIIKEIDEHNVASDIAATNIYIKLLKDRIAEQSAFSEIIANTTPGLNYVFNLTERHITYCNKNYLSFSGYTSERLFDKSTNVIEDMVHPEDIEITTEAINKCLAAANEEVISWEYRLKNSTSTYLWMRNYAAVFKRDEQGIPIEVVGLILDIDIEKDTANKLVLREKQLLEAQEQAQVGSFELDVATGKMIVTPQFSKIYEVNNDFDLYNLLEKVHPADRERINSNRANARYEGDIYDNEYRYIVNGKEKVLWSRGIISFKNGRKTLSGTAMDVTNRHHMLQQSQQNERLYKQAQELSHLGNWTWDLTTNECSWSDELYRIYDLQPQNPPVRPEVTREYRHPDDVARVDEAMTRLREDCLPCDYIFRIVLANNKIKYLHTKAEVLFNETGLAESMFGTVQDVTEKQELIEQLQQSDILFKQAQEISHTGNWSWNLATKKMTWSDELYRIYELYPQSIEASAALLSYSYPGDEEIISNTIRTALKAATSFDFNYRIVLSDGKIKHLNAKGSVTKDINGNQLKIFGTVQDITVQKQAEKQLKDYQEFIEKITDVTPSVIAAYNIHTGAYSFVNDAIEKLLGYTAKQVIAGGMAFMIDIVHPDDVMPLMAENTKALDDANQLKNIKEEPVVEFKYRMRNAKGEYRWFHTYGTIFERNAAGQVESVLNISVDITEQEEAEQVLFQKNQQLQQSNTSLEEYAYVASHDLKEPLRKITTFSDRMLSTQAATLNEDGKIFLGKIIDSSRRMQKMINDLLSVSTILGNKAYEMADLNILLSEAIQALDHKIEENNAVIEFSGLPTASVVPSQFRQLFQNLINNSLKFKREDIPSVIRVSAKLLGSSAGEQYGLARAKEYLQIAIEDNGIGFDNQYANKIFAIFQRLHGKSEYEGTGIGLAVCKKIIENHGGVIFASGIPNQSATFTMVIPV